MAAVRPRVADFYEPVEYGWSARRRKISELVREYSDHVHADY
jgi:hypothetical protein